MDSSSYHPAVAFDDLVGVHGTPFYGMVTGSRDLAGAAQAILGRAYRRRMRTPSRVIGEVIDSTKRSFFAGGITYEVLGEESPPVELPLYGAYYREFADALPEPKLARVDDVDSYAEFRATRREPYLAQLSARLDALESAFAAHVADTHGGGRVAALEEALKKHITECVCGGSPIDLDIPEAATGEVQAWQDGPEILVTLCVPCSGGGRFVTSGTPVQKHADEVVGWAIAEDVEMDDLMIVGPRMIELIGTARLVDQLVTAAPAAIDVCGAESGTVALVPATDPGLAAAMMLIQRCQMGDWGACAEVKRMEREHGPLLAHGLQRLSMAQSAYGGRA